MNILLIIFLILFFTISIVEMILSGKWNPYYFSYTIPIFNKTFEYSNLTLSSKNIENFINNMEKKDHFYHYKGKSIDKNTFFFRKKMVSVGFFRNDFENLHGIILIDTENQIIKLKCSISYCHILLSAYICLALWQESEFIFSDIIPILLTVLFFYSIFYFSNLIRYKKLLKEIEKLVN